MHELDAGSGQIAVLSLFGDDSKGQSLAENVEIWSVCVRLVICLRPMRDQCHEYRIWQQPTYDSCMASGVGSGVDVVASHERASDLL